MHISKQVQAGADVIQIFDSWAGLLPEKELPKYCYKPTFNIVKEFKNKVPIICFPRGIKNNYYDFCSIVKPDCISIDNEVDPKWIKTKCEDIAIQGGMDPKVLLEDKKQIEKETKKYLEIFSKRPYIFNLGHGVLPQTKPETIEFIINLVKDNK